MIAATYILVTESQDIRHLSAKANGFLTQPGVTIDVKDTLKPMHNSENSDRVSIQRNDLVRAIGRFSVNKDGSVSLSQVQVDSSVKAVFDVSPNLSRFVGAAADESWCIWIKQKTWRRFSLKLRAGVSLTEACFSSDGSKLLVLSSKRAGVNSNQTWIDLMTVNKTGVTRKHSISGVPSVEEYAGVFTHGHGWKVNFGSGSIGLNFDGKHLHQMRHEGVLSFKGLNDSSHVSLSLRGECRVGNNVIDRPTPTAQPYLGFSNNQILWQDTSLEELWLNRTKLAGFSQGFLCVLH